uniref:Uncharacterized protein n=1 Tax=Anguilla anguilla TaxID=7936 RepID=A0A0E9VMY7_ANGAN
MQVYSPVVPLGPMVMMVNKMKSTSIFSL